MKTIICNNGWNEKGLETTAGSTLIQKYSLLEMKMRGHRDLNKHGLEDSVVTADS